MSFKDKRNDQKYCWQEAICCLQVCMCVINGQAETKQKCVFHMFVIDTQVFFF